MKRKLHSNFRLISGIVTILIGILLTFPQVTGAYILIGVGCGYLITAFIPEDKMAEVVEKMLSQSDIIFFRIFELLSIWLIFMDGSKTIGILAFLSMISIEMIWRKKKVK